MPTTLCRPHTHTRIQEFADGSILRDVDLVLICTGYEYYLPFLTGGSCHNDKEPGEEGGDGPRLLRVQERAVFPMYQHLFHARFPSLAFMGLLHSVVPFRAWRVGMCARR